MALKVSPPSSLFRHYDRAEPGLKPGIRKIACDMLETELDFVAVFNSLHEIINKPQYASLKSQGQFTAKLDGWYSEVVKTNQNHRKNLGRLSNDLKFMIGSLPQTEMIYLELDNIQDNLKQGNEGDFSLRYSPQRVEDTITDILKVAFPNYHPPQPSYTSPQTTPAKPAFTPSPSPTPGYQRPLSPTPLVTNTQPQQTNQPPSQPAVYQPANSTHVSQSIPTYRIDQQGNKVLVSPTTTTYRSESPMPTRLSVATPLPTAPFQSSHEKDRATTPSRVTYNSSQPGSTLHPSSQYQPHQTPGDRSTTPSRTNPQPIQIMSPSNVYQPTTKVYIIDPITGEKKEKPEGYSSLTQTNSNSKPTQSIPLNRVETIADSPSSNLRTPSLIQARPVPLDLPLDKSTQKMIEEAKKDFGKYKLETFDTDDFPTKVEIGKDGSSVFYGGESLGLLKESNGWLTNQGVLFDNRCCTIKALENGELLVNCFETWDLVLLDENLNEKGKLQGTGKSVPSNFKKIKTRNSEDTPNILWLNGPEHLSIVNSQTFTSKEIRQFWKFKNSSVAPVACAISPSGKKIVGIGRNENSHTLHYYDGSDSVTIYQREDITDQVTAWDSLEITYDEDIFFIGGGGQPSHTSSGQAYVLAFTFNDGCDLVREKLLPEARTITALRRHTEGDILFAGGFRSIYVLFWHQKQLHSLSQIQVQLDRFCADLAFDFQKNALYAVFDAEKGIVVYFDEEYLNRRQGSGPQKPATPAKRRKLNQAVSSRPNEPTPYDPLNQGYLTYEQRVSLVKKPPRWAKLFQEFRIKQINIPNSTP